MNFVSFSKFNCIIKRSHGSAMVQAMTVVALVSMTTVGVMNHNVNVSKLPKIARIKDQMNDTKLSVMEAATTPFAYINCSSTTGVSSCELNNAYFGVSEQMVFGTNCGGAPCTVSLRGPNGTPNPMLDISDTNNPRFRAEIFYSGTDHNLAPLPIDLQIAKEVLQQSSMICPDATPIFAGFDNQNRLVCRALPADCSAGQYMSGFNSQTLTPVCRPILDPAACPANQFMTSFTWQNGAAPTRTCAARVDPFTYFAFNPDIDTTNPGGPPAWPPDPVIPPPLCAADGEVMSTMYNCTTVGDVSEPNSICCSGTMTGFCPSVGAIGVVMSCDGGGPPPQRCRCWDRAGGRGGDSTCSHDFFGGNQEGTRCHFDLNGVNYSGGVSERPGNISGRDRLQCCGFAIGGRRVCLEDAFGVCPGDTTP